MCWRRARYARSSGSWVACGFIQEIAARWCVRADGVDAESRHQAEVFGDSLELGELVALRVRRKRAVGDALDEEAFRAGAQEFPVGGETSSGIQSRARS